MMSRNDGRRTKKEPLVRKRRRIYVLDSWKIRLETKGSPEELNASRSRFMRALFLIRPNGIEINLHISAVVASFFLDLVLITRQETELPR